MCGISGVMADVGSEDCRQIVSRMNAAMVHRGPDDEGVWSEDGFGFGMRRLSIIDVAGGRQPLSNEDGTIWASLNGEIYNHPQTRFVASFVGTLSILKGKVIDRWDHPVLRRLRGEI